jgi:predicted Rossmann-fold nucleotide-binding protein
VLNVGGYFDPMIALLDHAVAQKFVKPEHRRHLLISADSEALVVEVMGLARSGSPRQRIDLDSD